VEITTQVPLTLDLQGDIMGELEGDLYARVLQSHFLLSNLLGWESLVEISTPDSGPIVS